MGGRRSDMALEASFEHVKGRLDGGQTMQIPIRALLVLDTWS